MGSLARSGEEDDEELDDEEEEDLDGGKFKSALSASNLSGPQRTAGFSTGNRKTPEGMSLFSYERLTKYFLQDVQISLPGYGNGSDAS